VNDTPVPLLNAMNALRAYWQALGDNQIPFTLPEAFDGYYNLWINLSNEQRHRLLGMSLADPTAPTRGNHEPDE
jgi:hypothetical protein